MILCNQKYQQEQQQEQRQMDEQNLSNPYLNRTAYASAIT